MDFFSNTADAKAVEAPVSIHDFWLLALRWIAGFSLVYFQAWSQIKMAWGFVWDKVDWPLVSQMQAISFPSPNILAPVLAFLLMLVSVGLILGFLSRIISLIGLLSCGLVMVTQLELSDTLTSQTLVLYCSIFVVLIFAGGGRISLDSLLTRRKDPA